MVRLPPTTKIWPYESFSHEIPKIRELQFWLDVGRSRNLKAPRPRSAGVLYRGRGTLALILLASLAGCAAPLGKVDIRQADATHETPAFGAPVTLERLDGAKAG